MLEMIFNLLTHVIKFVYAYLVLHITQKINIKYGHLIGYIIFYSIGHILLRDVGGEVTIQQCLYMFIFLYLLARKKSSERNTAIPLICISLFSYEVINITANFIWAMIALFFSNFSMTMNSIFTTFLVVSKCIILCYILKLIKKNSFQVLKKITGNYLVCFIYFLAIFIRLPFLYTDFRDGFTLKVVLGSICCCTAIFFIISQIDKRNAAKEKAWVEEKNKILTAKLHKSQEILPAMVQVLSDVTEKNGTEMEEHKAHKLLEEVSNLYEQQLKENGKEDLQLKSFCTTGLTVLDQQLNNYQYEAIDKEFNFDIFIQAPIDGVIRKQDIDQLRLQRAIGDLIRNAFHAVGKAHGRGGHILLIIGCQYENVLEVAVMDDGIEIPLSVLEAFGKRGVTTGGTGNGLADIWEFAKEMKASIRVDEFEGKANSFTKKISIIFNEQEMCHLNSPRRKMIKTSFWDN